jgi:MerR family transcriptional regulator, light-induced transcriptional regulator
LIYVYEELGESSRRDILNELRTGPKSVSDLVRATGLKQPNVSNHLSRMKTRGVVRAEKTGRQVFYSFATLEVADIVRAAFAEDPDSFQPIDYDEQSKLFAKAAMSGEEFQCGEIVEAALRRNVSLVEIYEQLLGRAMHHIGAWYSLGAIDEAQEHIASEITLRSMYRVVHSHGLVKRIERTVVLGCAPNTFHMIGLNMIADLLRINGWKTIFLGANVPPTAFLATVKQHRPDLVLVSCVSEDAMEATLDLTSQLAELRDKRNQFLIGVGGPVVQDNWERFSAAGASFSAPTLSDFAQRCLPQIEKTGRIDS